MMFRNLMAMDVEEMVRAQPMDAVVLVGGCDKTVPAQLMGAASADMPAVQLVAGPMMPTSHHGERLGACTDCRRFWAKYRAGEISTHDIDDIEGNLATTAGTCAVMGTASTMAAIAEALGMALPGSAAIPAVHADRLRAAEASGRRAVALIGTAIRPSRDHHRKIGRERAARAARDRRLDQRASFTSPRSRGALGIEMSLERLNELSDETPVLVDLKPTGQHYMSDLFAGRRHRRGAARTQAAAASRLHDGDRRNARRAAGADAAPWVDRAVVRPLGRAVSEAGRAGRAVRLARAERRDPQALGGRSAACSSAKAAPWCSPRSTISPRASTRPTST